MIFSFLVQMDIRMLRGITTQCLQVNNLARVADLLKLLATDVTRVILEGVPALCIQFRTAKNDPQYR